MLWTHALASWTILKRADPPMTIVTPKEVPLSEVWDGNDGPWSSFVVQAGWDNPQTTRLLPSTTLGQTYMIAPMGCLDSWKNYTFPRGLSCDESRGKLFQNMGRIEAQARLGIKYAFEANLKLFQTFSLYGFMDIAVQFWFDNLAFGYGENASGMGAQVPLGITSDINFTWTGLLGIDPRPFNFTFSSGKYESRRSLLQVIRDQKLIPSLTWAYHAGSQGRDRANPTSYGSLILGGYDKSRWSGAAIEFPFVMDSEQAISLRVLSIGLHHSGSVQDTEDLSLKFDDNKADLLGYVGYISRIDSSRPYLYLPQTTCDEIQAKLNLTWDDASRHYLIDNMTHRELQTKNPTLIFDLAPVSTTDTNSTSQRISLPYSALALQLEFPHLDIGNSSYYFPMMPTNDSKQFVLGRAFLQEAYLIANYERQTFSLSQVNWAGIKHPAIAIPISSANYSTPPYIGLSNNTVGHDQTKAAIIGNAVSAIVLGIALLAFCSLGVRRWRIDIAIKRIKDEEGSTADKDTDSSSGESAAISSELTGSPLSPDIPLDGKLLEADGAGVEITELDASKQILEMPDSTRTLIELDGEAKEIFEMEGNSATPTPVNGKGRVVFVNNNLETPPPPAYTSTVEAASPIPQTPREYYGRHAHRRFGFTREDINRSQGLDTIHSERDGSSTGTSEVKQPASAIPQTPTKWYGSRLPAWRQERERRAAVSEQGAATERLDAGPLPEMDPKLFQPENDNHKRNLVVPSQGDAPHTPASPIPQTPLEFYGRVPANLGDVDQRGWVGRAPDVPNINLIPATPADYKQPVPFRSPRRSTENRPPSEEVVKEEGGDDQKKERSASVKEAAETMEQELKKDEKDRKSKGGKR